MDTPNPQAAALRLPGIVARHMQDRGLTRYRLGLLAGIPLTTLTSRLGGQPFRADELARVADALGVRGSDLWREAEADAA